MSVVRESVSLLQPNAKDLTEGKFEILEHFVIATKSVASFSIECM